MNRRFVNLYKGIGAGIFLSLLMVTAAADWPQMGGPDRNNISRETVPLARKWPADGPEMLWSVPLGGGFASPSVSQGLVYLLDRVEDKQDNLRCFDLETGEEKWNYAYDAPGSVSYDGSRTAPTIEGNRLYCVGLLGDFHCIDLDTHQPLWRKNICKDFGQKVPDWGVAQAPSLYKDLVIVAPQAPDAFVAAYRKEDGELVWQTKMQGQVGYSTPVIVNLCGVDQAVMICETPPKDSGIGSVNGISLEDGRILWTYHNWECMIPIPFATALPDDRLFITGGYKAGSSMIQIHKEGNRFQVRELFKTDACGSQIQQPLFYKEHLYVNSNSNEREDGLMCLTLDGTVLWQTRDKKKSHFSTTFERGSLILADDLLIELDGKRGDLYLIEPSPEGYKELTNAHVLDGKQLWSPMVLSKGRLLVRSSDLLKCLDISARP